MKKLILILAVLMPILWMACGKKEGTTGPPLPLPPVRVIADTTASAPNLSSADEPVWSSVDSFQIPVSQANTPKLIPNMAAAIPTSIYVQAIKNSGSLYLRLQWSDPTFDAYLDHFEVTKTTSPLEFTQQLLPPAYEDQIFVMFDSLAQGGYDVWNWRVLTTGAGRLGKGYSYKANSLVADSAGTSSDSVTVANPPYFKYPTYAHKDTSEFNGYILYTTDTIKWSDTLRMEYDPILKDSFPVFFYNTTGWTLGQKVPGWLIDSSFASLSEVERGSRWDIQAVSVYDSVAAQYRVVLCRKLNTGFNVNEDIDLSAMDSVEVKIGIYDNQKDFEGASNKRGFSDNFWIIFK